MTNNELHQAQYDAWERGYKEALLDVYLFLTANEGVYAIDETRLDLIVAMTEQITATSKLALYEEPQRIA